MKKEQSEHRGTIDIIVNILDIAKGGVNKTGIMYGGNLSFKQANKYLGFFTNSSADFSQLSQKRRSRLGIITEFLEAARGGIKKTHAMYRCNLSFTQLDEYLKLLYGLQLLEETAGVNKTTGKGLTVLESYADLKAHVNSHGELLTCKNVEDKQIYETTEKGKALLGKYGNLQALLNPTESAGEGSIVSYAEKL